MVTENENIYTDLEVISIYNYNKATGGELVYLKVDRTKKEKEEDLQKAMVILKDKESEINYNGEAEVYYNNFAEIKWLETRLKVVPTLLNMLLSTVNRKEVIKELKTWKIYISEKKAIKPQIQTSINILNNSKNKISRKAEDLKEKNKVGTTEMSLQKMAVKIHKTLGIKPDIFKDSVITWFSYFDEINALKSIK